MPVYAPDTSGKGLAVKPRGSGLLDDQPMYSTQSPTPQGPAPQAPPQTYPSGYNPTAGGVGTYSNPSEGSTGKYYSPSPSQTANLFETGNTGTSQVGQGTLAPGAYEQQQQSQLEEQMWKERFGMISPYIGTPGGNVQGPHIGGAMTPEEQAARAAAFARAKEQSGGTALSAMKGLQDSMSARGLSGSTGRGLEGGGINDVLSGAAGGVNDFTREQLIQDLNRYSGIADRTYAGDITQRGQDIDARKAIIGLLNSGKLF
jgi:hypothetical protein